MYDSGLSAYSSVILTFVFASYFTQGIAQDKILGTHLWGNAIAISGIIIAIVGPIAGAIADSYGKRKPWLFLFTVITVLSAALLWFAKPNPDYITWALFWVILGNIGLETSFVIYNSMMRDLVSERFLGKLSGLAWGAGYAGGLICLFMALFLVEAKYSGFPISSTNAEHVRASGPLVAIWFGLLSIPLFLFVPDKNKGLEFLSSCYQGLSNLFKTLKNASKEKNIWLYLLARMLYMDALNTLFAFGGIYAAGTFGLQPAEIIQFGILTNIFAGLGAALFSWVDDYIGSKITVFLGLLVIILCVTALLFVETKFWFWTFALSLSVFVGPVQAASRSLMARLSPRERMAEFFGLYALTGKATSFLCPWLVGLFTYWFQSQRVGMSTLLLFFIPGAILLMFVKSKKIFY